MTINAKGIVVNQGEGIRLYNEIVIDENTETHDLLMCFFLYEYHIQVYVGLM